MTVDMGIKMSKNNKKLFELVRSFRLRETSLARNKNILIATESDKGRVINLSAFRRLQQKAQVFPLDDNAAVRTRLTHSIEVSQVGRYLAQKVIKRLRLEKSEYEKLAAFVNTVESSCLLHDIGNPPFGHLGEVAIRKWMSKRAVNDDLLKHHELKFFDGNPQGLRFSTFLGGSDDYGLNLTASLILSSIKYPCDFRESENKNKFGYFEHERKVYLDACEKVGWTPGNVFPLAKLMEAADDISYCTSDLEDGLEKGVITEQMLCDNFLDYKKIADDKGARAVDSFIKFKTDLINDAVSEVADLFVYNLSDILAGVPVSIVNKNSEVGKKIEYIKKFVLENIYTNDSVEKMEIAENTVINGILAHFDQLLDLSDEDFLKLEIGDGDFIKENNLDFDYRIFKLLPRSYVEKYKAMLASNTVSEKDARLHLIIDFIAGMTDSFAIYLYQVLNGIRIK